MAHQRFWRPPDFSDLHGGLIGKIRSHFHAIYPEDQSGDLAPRICRYWTETLCSIQSARAGELVEKDSHYDTTAPLSRIHQKVVVIAYADSVKERGQPSLAVLDDFLSERFPAVGGLHLLPACVMAHDRFNDGGFSQIRRDSADPAFGTNADFARLMEKYVSMTDFVLNHVDIDHAVFRRYLEGDDDAGRCFYVFSESEYQEKLARGDFDSIFRPRPFPLFTIFRRTPSGQFATLSRDRRLEAVNGRFAAKGLSPLAGEVIGLMSCFEKVKNDQMLLEDDYGDVAAFRIWLMAETDLDPDRILALSQTQETRHPPYIFAEEVQSPEDLLQLLLPAMGMSKRKAKDYAEAFRACENEIFGKPIRALTTFSHVQVDLNTSTFEGLKLLADDFAWYLSMDLNMLRLDAANFAFKKWGTSCFGLPQLRQLMEILYLSMAAVAPRMVPNLEVNAPLGVVLRQMADPESAPPMIYDFHLASMLPVVFNEANARPLERIAPLVHEFDICPASIRFSLDESHDGKSVSGSGGADPLLTYAQRRSLVETVRANGGHIKYKSVPKGRMDSREFDKICHESGMERQRAAEALFETDSLGAPLMAVKASVDSLPALARALQVPPERFQDDAALAFLADKLLSGREPYELCVSTRDCLVRLDDPKLEIRRYLALKTLGFALMGRHVKAVYINDLMGLPNDPELVRRTGELRNIKRTRSLRSKLESLWNDPARFEFWVARSMNNLIALVDNDPALSPLGGGEARVVTAPDRPAVALVCNTFGPHASLTIVNTSQRRIEVSMEVPELAPDPPGFENLAGAPEHAWWQANRLCLDLAPYDRLWLTRAPVAIPSRSKVALPELEQMDKLPTGRLSFRY